MPGTIGGTVSCRRRRRVVPGPERWSSTRCRPAAMEAKSARHFWDKWMGITASGAMSMSRASHAWCMVGKLLVGEGTLDALIRWRLRGLPPDCNLRPSVIVDALDDDPIARRTQDDFDAITRREPDCTSRRCARPSWPATITYRVPFLIAASGRKGVHPLVQHDFHRPGGRWSPSSGDEAEAPPFRRERVVDRGLREDRGGSPTGLTAETTVACRPAAPARVGRARPTRPARASGR
jgi:hypothetical protein